MQSTTPTLTCLPLILACAFAVSAPVIAAEDKAPNILLIMSDDENCDTVAGYHRNPNAESPALDALAEDGVFFANAFANAPQCATSRRSVAAGKYPHHVGCYDFSKTHDATDFYKPDMYTVLYKQLDYFHAMAGKDHTFFRYQDGIVKHGKLQPRFWEIALRKSRYSPDRDFYLYVTDEKGRTHIQRNTEPPPEEDEKYGIIRAYTNEHPRERENIWAGYNPRGDGETLDDYIFKDYQSILDMRLDAKDDRPTTMMLSFVYPHTPILPPEEIARRFEQMDFPIPEFTEEELESIRKEAPQMAEFIRLTKSYDMTDAEKEKVLQHYYAFAAYGQQLAGRAIEDWKAFSEAQGRPWLIVYTADQGWHVHEHGLCSKFTTYDESVRVPLIIASSDKQAFPPGTRYEGMVELVDLAPTFLKAAGLDPNLPEYKDNFDGQPLQDLISGKLPPKDHVLCETGHQVIGWRALYRTDRWAFSMKHRPEDLTLGQDYDWAKRQPPENLDMQLFDLSNDPDEKHNLAYDPAYREIRDQLRAQLETTFLGPDRNEFDWAAHPLPPFEPAQTL